MLVPDSTGPEGQYAVAYAAHYSGADISGALEGYVQIVERYPDSAEAGYARSQILNVLTSLVPQGKVLAAHLTLIRDELTRPERSA